MAGYTRQSVADIVPTAVVRAAPINAEYNKLRDAFTHSTTGTTGHKHDGSSDEGSYVPLIADLDALNKIVVDTTNNRHGVFVEVSSAAVEQVRFQDGVILPVVDNDIDLGSSTYELKNVYVDGTAYIDTVSIGDNDYTTITNNAYTVTGNMTFDVSGNINLDADGGNVALQDAGTTYATFTNTAGNLILKSGTTSAVIFSGANADFYGTVDVTGAATFDSTVLVKGNTTLGDAVTDSVTYTARAASNFLPITDATYDLGSNSVEWNNLWIDGTANVDTLQVDENANVTGAMSVGGNMSTTGNNSIGGTLGVTGATTLSSTLGVTGATTLASTLAVTGASTLTGVVTAPAGVVGNLTGNVTAASGESIFNNVTINGTVDFTNTALVNVTDPTSAQHAATKNYVDTQINNLIGGAPATLDTLNEIAAAINDDANAYTTLASSIATKLPLAGGTMTGAIAMGNNKITGLGTPTTSSDAVTKAYVDTTFGSLSDAATYAAQAAASAAAAETSYDSFDDRYLGAKSSSPATDNDGNALITGALYFDTTANLMKVYDGSSWVDAGSAVNGTSERQVYTATSGQTVFPVVYDTGFVDVWLNGVKLQAGVDFTATNGTSITLTTGATAGDIVDIIAFGAFSLADVYTQTQSDLRFLRIGNDLSDLNNAATARTNLGLVIGTDVQAYDANLTSFITAVNLPTADGTAGQFLKTDGAGTVSFADIPTINTLDDVGDVTITSASAGQVLSWNGSAWVNSTLEAFDTQTASTSSTSQTAIASYAVASYDGVKAVVTVADSVSGNRTITELIITHDGTTAVATEYAIVNTATKLAEFDVDISTGNVRLLATPASSNSMSFTVKAITL